jgi:hypothetical protein
VIAGHPAIHNHAQTARARERRISTAVGFVDVADPQTVEELQELEGFQRRVLETAMWWRDKGVRHDYRVAAAAENLRATLVKLQEAGGEPANESHEALRVAATIP